MSFDPLACALSRSWCTSWKSRVAIAVETMNVGSPYSASSGSFRADLNDRRAHAGSHAYSVHAAPIPWSGKSIYVARTGIPISHRRGVDVAQLTEHPHPLPRVRRAR